jgi:hypothetical protein
MRRTLFGGVKSFITSPPGYRLAGEGSSGRLDCSHLRGEYHEPERVLLNSPLLVTDQDVEIS